MASQPKILAFAGSTRSGSWNKKLIRVGAAAAQAAGADVTLVDLQEFPMPLYDGDDEQAGGLPPKAKALKAMFREHQGLLIASPEYNSSVTAVLKNALDWISRSESKDEPGLSAFRGKTAAIMSASTGALGGLRGLTQLRTILGNIQVLVLPEQVTVSSAQDAFDDSGQLKDGTKADSVRKLAGRLVDIVSKTSA